MKIKIVGAVTDDKGVFHDFVLTEDDIIRLIMAKADDAGIEYAAPYIIHIMVQE
jgi:hypothetical protein